MTRLLLILILLVPSLSWAATISVDPDCANNGDGTSTSCAASGGAPGAKNTWVGLAMSGGNTYAGKGGASETLASYQIPASGTVGNLITITSYGTGEFKFTSSTTYAVATVSRSYVTFDNVTFESTATNCLYLTGIGSNIVVSNSTFLTCGTSNGTQSAVLIEGASDTADLDNLTITGNTFTDIKGWAVRLNDINVGNSSTWNALAITNNTISNAGSGGNTGAVKVAMSGGTTATGTNISITGNTITLVGDEESDPVHQIQVVRSPQGSAHEDRFKGVIIDNNTLTNGGGAISVNNIGILSGVTNSISGNTLSTLSATAGIIGFYSQNILVERNSITGIATYAAISNIDGIGIDLDLGNTGWTVRRNIITNCLGNASADSSGQGIAIFGSELNAVYGNLLIGNRYGVLFGDDNAGVAGNPNYIHNNTIVGSLFDGIRTVFTVEQVNHIQNNIILNSGRYGINSAGTGTQTLVTNDFYNNTSGNYNSQTAGATDITTTPLLISATDYRTQGGSLARHAGTASPYCLDYRGRVCSGTPDIGAYQATHGDPVGTGGAAIRGAASSRTLRGSSGFNYILQEINDKFLVEDGSGSLLKE